MQRENCGVGGKKQKATHETPIKIEAPETINKVEGSLEYVYAFVHDITRQGHCFGRVEHQRSTLNALM